jgi:hypothetical protein
MKKFNHTRTFAIAVIAAFTVAFTTPALANDGNAPVPVEVKYLGQFKNQPVFEVNFGSETDNEFIVVIRDEEDNVLYKDFIKVGTTSKKYLLNTEELGEIPLKFEITGRKTDKTVIYSVNKSTRIINDVVVNKVK